METNNNSKSYIIETHDAKVENPTLPIPGKRNILVTSALPYVNNVPHLGNIVGSVLSADAFSRYLKLRGENCIFICGTDEYGTATETKAAQEGLTPREICDKYNKIHKEIYDWFDIKFDKFGRTSTEQQTKIAQDIFLQLYKNNCLVEDTIQQLYCEKCQKLLADRFVEGTCPFCSFPDARGDQCDGCGKLINAIELINPSCKLDRTRPVIRSTQHLNLDLPKLTERLEKFVEESIAKGKWSQNAINVTRGWLKEGLKQRCLTRDLKWGIPVPIEKFKEKVLYVWFDAPIGYISITATYTDQWELWWKNPKEVQLYQFMGKDNIPFHTVIFPSCLLGSEYNWTLLNSISTTEYLNYEGGKFSKSRGSGVFGTDAKSTGIPAEVWRYYLLANRPEVSDSSFSWDDLMTKTNGELLANLGNFVNRVLSFCKKEFAGKVPVAKPNQDDEKFIADVTKEIKEYIKFLDDVHIKDGLKTAMGISKLGNVYLQENKPWDLLKTNPERCGTVVAVALNLTKSLAALLEPYMPPTSAKIYSQLNLPHAQIKDEFTLDIPSGHEIGTPQVLFKKLEEAEIKKFQQTFSGTQENKKEGFPADLRGGVIISVDDHPNDENLYLIKVDLGKEQRQAVARLKSVYKKEELQGRQVVVLCNLPVAEFKGTKSEGMLLVAEAKNKNKEIEQRLLQADTKTDDWLGKQIVPEGTSLPQTKANITLKEFQKLDLKLGKDGKVVYQGKHALKVSEKIGITAEGIEGPAKIK